MLGPSAGGCALSQRGTEDVGVDIAARQHDGHGAAAAIDFAGQHGRQRHGAARLDDQLEDAEGVFHRHCDLRIAGDGSKFGAPVQRLGITMPYPEIAALMELVGRATTIELLIEGRMLGAREAYEKGLVCRVVPDSAVEEEAAAAARRIADGSSVR